MRPRRIGGLEVVVAEPSHARGWLKLVKDVAEEGRFLALERVDLKPRRLARHFAKRAWDVGECSIVAVREDEVIGQLTAVRDSGIYRHAAEIGMSVSADHRRKGVGAALIGGASEWARWAGVEKLTLMVFPHNEVAIKFYEASGFVREGLRRRHAKMAYGYEDLAEMSLFLD